MCRERRFSGMGLRTHCFVGAEGTMRCDSFHIPPTLDAHPGMGTDATQIIGPLMLPGSADATRSSIGNLGLQVCVYLPQATAATWAC